MPLPTSTPLLMWSHTFYSREPTNEWMNVTCERRLRSAMRCDPTSTTNPIGSLRLCWWWVFVRDRAHVYAYVISFTFSSHIGKCNPLRVWVCVLTGWFWRKWLVLWMGGISLTLAALREAWVRQLEYARLRAKVVSMVVVLEGSYGFWEARLGVNVQEAMRFYTAFANLTGVSSWIGWNWTGVADSCWRFVGVCYPGVNWARVRVKSKRTFR